MVASRDPRAVTSSIEKFDVSNRAATGTTNTGAINYHTCSTGSRTGSRMLDVSRVPKEIQLGGVLTIISISILKWINRNSHIHRNAENNGKLGVGPPSLLPVISAKSIVKRELVAAAPNSSKKITSNLSNSSIWNPSNTFADAYLLISIISAVAAITLFSVTAYFVRYLKA